MNQILNERLNNPIVLSEGFLQYFYRKIKKIKHIINKNKSQSRFKI